LGQTTLLNSEPAKDHTISNQTPKNVFLKTSIHRPLDCELHRPGEEAKDGGENWAYEQESMNGRIRFEGFESAISGP